jgi:hypothetical protein
MRGKGRYFIPHPLRGFENPHPVSLSFIKGGGIKFERGLTPPLAAHSYLGRDWQDEGYNTDC